MNCRRAKRLMPFYAGNDLSAGRTRSVGAHLASCPDCRRELEEYRRALGTVRAAAQAEAAPDWSDGEWRAVVARAVKGGRGGRKKRAAVRGPILRPRWAVAAGAAAALVVAAGMLLWQNTGIRPGPAAAVRAAGERGLRLAEDPPAQDVVSVTLVSQETGLQVVWFFHKDFEWKGDQE
jgi:anti-sigma factor RsiW